MGLEVPAQASYCRATATRLLLSVYVVGSMQVPEHGHMDMWGSQSALQALKHIQVLQGAQPCHLHG